MPEHVFTVFLHSDPTDDEADVLYGVCDDGTLSTLAGIPQITFHRDAGSLEDAVATAIRDVETAGLAVREWASETDHELEDAITTAFRDIETTGLTGRESLMRLSHPHSVRGQLLVCRDDAVATNQASHALAFADTADAFHITRMEVAKHAIANETDTAVEHRLVEIARTVRPPTMPDTRHRPAHAVVTPNWLVGASARHQGSASGPGGRPVAPASLQAVSGVDPWQFVLPPALTETPPEQRGAGVEIFILDTAPTQRQLDAAYQRWHATNPLIARLLASGGPLHLHTIDAVEQHLAVDVDYAIPDHPYPMGDHGLFVASIIHTIAPQTTLHLVRVLNDYGVGSYESVLRGFQFVHQSAHGSKVLINASLCFDLAQPDQDWLDHWSKFDPFWVGWHPEEIKWMAQPLDRACQLLHRRGHQIVAAAGNDREGLDDVLPPARFPAANTHVLGVGALRRDHTPAPYSNISDVPRGDGLATFGGHSNATTDVTDATDGMLGVYIGTYPDKTPNITGFARWAGTSFAAPVITGALAVLVADGYTTEDALQKLRDTTPGSANQTDLGEVFPVTQGGLWSDA